MCALCNQAVILYKDGKYERVGEPTEAALKVLIGHMGDPSSQELLRQSPLALGAIVQRGEPPELVQQVISYFVDTIQPGAPRVRSQIF